MIFPLSAIAIKKKHPIRIKAIYFIINVYSTSESIFHKNANDLFN